MIEGGYDGLSTAKACRALGVSESGYYEWQAREPKPQNTQLTSEIHAIKSKFFFYGYRRVKQELQRRAYPVGEKKVLSIMQKEGLTVRKKRYTPKTTQSDHSLKRYPNRLLNFTPTAINQAFVADITYVPIANLFAYLALIMDLFSRKIVGWDLSWNPDRYLTLSALHKAIELRGAQNLIGCIFHSDHGKQYLCKDHIQMLESVGMLPSTGEIGNSYDNAHAESLNKSIKSEAVYPYEFETFEEAYRILSSHIKLYNKGRLHSGIGYLPPDEFEKKGGLK